MLKKNQIQTLAFNLKAVLNANKKIGICQIADQIAKATGFKSIQAHASCSVETVETSSKELDLEFLSKLPHASALEVNGIYLRVTNTDVMKNDTYMYDELVDYVNKIHAPNVDIDNIGCEHDYIIYSEGDFDSASWYLYTVDALPIKKKTVNAESGLTTWILANDETLYMYKQVSF